MGLALLLLAEGVRLKPVDSRQRRAAGGAVKAAASAVLGIYITVDLDRGPIQGACSKTFQLSQKTRTGFSNGASSPVASLWR